MILAAAIIFSFLFGCVLTFTAMKLFQNDLCQEIKADAQIALEKQAEDSYRAGYMRAEIEHAKRKREKTTNDDTIVTFFIR